MNNEDAIHFLLNSNEYHHAKGDLPCSAASIEAFNKAIYALKAERPKGNWNCIQSDMLVCPFCGADPHKDYKNFCAKCGADLRVCCGDCEVCLNKTFDSIGVYEFICDLDGHVVLLKESENE